MKGKTNRGLSPWQKFQFRRNFLISRIKIRDEGRNFFRTFAKICFSLAFSQLLSIESTGHRRAGMCEEVEGGWLKSDG